MAQLGSGNGTGWPGVLDTRQTYVNGANTGGDSNSRVDAEVLNDILSFLVQLQTILGTNPHGPYASVRARLDATVGTASAAYNPTGVVLGGATGQLIDAYPDVLVLTAFRRFQTYGRVFETYLGTVATSNGASFVSSSAFIPAGVQIDGVMIRNTQTWGNGNGLTGIHVGELTDPDRWGANIARTLNATNNVGLFTNLNPLRTTTATGVTLTAAAGTFSTTGGCNVAAYCQYFLPAP